MNNRPRIIPNLTIKNRELIKTKKFKDWKYLGDPINVVKIFNEKCADEIIISDITGGNPDFEFIEQIVSECFMPVCYGGGIRSVDDIQKIMSLGVEKVCLRTLAIDNDQEFVTAINNFGSSAIVASLDIKETIFGLNLITRNRIRRIRAADLKNLIEVLIEMGVGELIFQSVNADGTLRGYDFKLMDQFIQNCSIPCLISGGCSSNKDIEEAFRKKYDGVVVGRHFALKPPQNGVLIQYPNEDLFDRIVSNR